MPREATSTEIQEFKNRYQQQFEELISSGDEFALELLQNNPKAGPKQELFCTRYKELMSLFLKKTVEDKDAKDAFLKALEMNSGNTKSYNKQLLIIEINRQIQEEVSNLSFEHRAIKAPINPASNFDCSSFFSLQVWGGFMMALGAAAVAIAFIALYSPALIFTGGIVACAGLATLTLGLGLFASTVKEDSPFACDETTMNRLTWSRTA
ncbi:MAG TPA: hypothetical protein PK657_04180 [Legionella sp.]|nr:hypothetical protein [Legionella sp.]